MGDPTEPGQQQLTTLRIVGPRVNATPAELQAFALKFAAYKQALQNLGAQVTKIEYSTP